MGTSNMEHVELTQEEFDSVPYERAGFDTSEADRWREYGQFNGWLLVERIDHGTEMGLLYRIIDIVSPLQRADKGPHDEGCSKTGYNPRSGYFCCDTFAVDYNWGTNVPEEEVEPDEQDVDVKDFAGDSPDSKRTHGTQRTDITLTMQGHSLHPGDRVLIALHDGTSTEGAVDIKEKLNERFPGVEFTFLLGAGVVVMGQSEESWTARAAAVLKDLERRK